MADTEVIKRIQIGPVVFKVCKRGGQNPYYIMLGNLFYSSCGDYFETADEAEKALRKHFV